MAYDPRGNGNELNLRVAASSSFTVGERIVIESLYDGWQQEAAVVTTKDVTSPPSLQLDRALIFGAAVGDVVRSEWYFPSCTVADDTWPLRDDANGLQSTLALRFKTFRGLVQTVAP